jgi:two-component system, OmpR family, sensor histidine kinase BaeS
MKSLVAKLTLAFLVVAVAGVGLAALIVRRSTQREFDQLVLTQNQQALTQYLLSYYLLNKSWAGVENLVDARGGAYHGAPEPDGHWNDRRELFVLADKDGTIIFGGGQEYLGKTLRKKDLQKGVALVSGDETVGTLIFLPTIDRWKSGTPEGDFLASFSRAIIIGAMAAVLLAVILGRVLAQTLTQTLRNLTAATREVTAGNLGNQVEVHSRDELGDLAIAFNQMSSELQRSNEAEQEQLRLRQQREAQNRAMTANIAHDLRSPLSVILGYTEALNDGILDPSPDIFGIMHTEAQHLNHLIDDLKTLSLADAGELPLSLQPVAPARIIQRVVDAYQIQANRKRIHLEAHAVPDLPEINVDIERIVQVLGNLMSNALRYTPEGGTITLTGTSAGADEKAGTAVRVLFLVSDSGPGIAPEDLPHIFERTYRGDPARGQANGETGLGLTIAQSLVTAMGGAISVESRHGEGVPGGTGTTFTLAFS